MPSFIGKLQSVCQCACTHSYIHSCTSILLYVDCNEVGCIGSHFFVLYIHFLIFLSVCACSTHFALSLQSARDHSHRHRYTPANIGISSYREPFYLMYDPANAIDKTTHLSLTLYGDRLSRSFVCFISPPPSSTIVPGSPVFLREIPSMRG